VMSEKRSTWACVAALSLLVAPRWIAPDDVKVRRLQAEEIVLVDAMGAPWGRWKTAKLGEETGVAAVLEIGTPSGMSVVRIGCYASGYSGSTKSTDGDLRIELIQDTTIGARASIEALPSGKSEMALTSKHGQFGAKLALNSGRSKATVETFGSHDQRAILGQYVLNEAPNDSGGPSETSGAGTLILVDGYNKRTCGLGAGGEITKDWLAEYR